MTRLTRVGLLLSGLVLLISVSPASAEKRGVAVAPAAAGSVPITGDYWALIIGIDEYQHVPKLTTAVRDAKAVRDVLIQRYGFQKERVLTLFDAQATRGAIEDALYALGQKARPTDSVFLYYAGHGQTDSEKVRGWWVPVEGQAKSPGTFISNALIRDDIAAMKAKHVYLVADSCFSGTLFGKARDLPPIDDKFYATLYANKSRWGLTSGMNEPVADTGKEGHSIFAYFFLKFLKENADPYLAPSDIYKAIARVISNNAEQQPVSQPLKNAGDEDGQFVFRLASASGGPLPSPRQRAPSFTQPPAKDVDVSGYSSLEADAALADKREQAWGKVQGYAGKTSVSREKRLAALDKFLQDFAEDNPHKTDVEMLRQQIVQEDKQQELQEAERLARQKQAQREAEHRQAEERPKLEAEQQEQAEITELRKWAERQREGWELEKRQQTEEQKKKQLEVASLPTPSLPRQTGREITGRDGAPMVLVPEGEFLYGDNNRRLSLSAFYMDKYEVTTDLYAKFLQATGRKKPEYWESGGIFSTATWKAYGNRPVVGVDWHDADAYCRYYGKRLPTEQEWEKAARGTDGRTYPWGNDEPSGRYANFGQSYDGNFYSTRLTAVGNYEAGKSPYGIYDMAGNVWEWTSSDYNSSSKVLRGGSWDDRADIVRSAYRVSNPPSTRYYYFGFRCAKTP